ncbi:MAG: tetratricopeptide repeat protein [Leptolyngbyaceae cyanobacterium bins.59]|nr:tetratricopeptide repeat protein [Leptolyngbyaceae cyanobacterium bins.59]
MGWQQPCKRTVLWGFSFMALLLSVPVPTIALPMDLSDPGALTQDRTSRAALIREGNDFYNQGKFSEAEAAFRKVVTSFPNDAVSHYKLGNALLRQEKFEAAIGSYQEAVRLNPNYALAYNALGVALEGQNQTSESIEHYRRALAINPNYAEALANLGQSLWNQGQRQEAIRSLQRARNIYKEQGRTLESQRIDRFLQQITTAEPTIS